MSQLEILGGAGSETAPLGCWGILHCHSFTQLHLSDSVGWFSSLLGAIEPAQNWSFPLFHYNKSPRCGQNPSFLFNTRTYAIFSLSWSCFFNGNKMLFFGGFFSSLNKKGGIVSWTFLKQNFLTQRQLVMMLPDSLSPIYARWRQSWDSAAYLSSVALNVIFILLLCSSIWQISTKKGFDPKCKRAVISSSSYSSRQSDLGEKSKSVGIGSKEKELGNFKVSSKISSSMVDLQPSHPGVSLSLFVCVSRSPSPL